MPGDSVCLPQRLYHKFWGAEDKGTVLVGALADLVHAPLRGIDCGAHVAGGDDLGAFATGKVVAFRQEIADSWPQSIDDSAAREEWGWKPEYDLDTMTADMLEKLREKP